MAGDDESRDDAERTRIGGLPPPIPKQPAAAAPAAPASSDAGERTQIAPARPPGAPGAAAPRPPEQQPAAEDQAERTRIVSGAPPRPMPAAPAPPAASEGGDRTQVIASPPPGAARAAAPATPAVAAPDAVAGGDRTQVVASPPPGSARAVPLPAPAAPPPAAAPPAAAPPPAPMADVTVDPARGRPAADDEERTVVLTRRVECTVHLERVAPAGTAEVIDLDRPNLVLGRGHGCDVKLRTPTASREHARIFFKDGRWTIAGIERRTFYVDGTRHAGGEIPLQGGMRVRLGDDEFVVIDDAGGSAVAGGRGGLWARVVSFLRGLVGRRD